METEKHANQLVFLAAPRSDWRRVRPFFNSLTGLETKITCSWLRLCLGTPLTTYGSHKHTQEKVISLLCHCSSRVPNSGVLGLLVINSYRLN